jgi:hypothetical protein
MNDQSLFALAKECGAVYLVNLDELVFSRFAWKAFAAALAREQEAQPAPTDLLCACGAYWEPNGAGWKMLTPPKALRAAQPAAQEPSEADLIELLRPFAADGGRWPSDWLDAARAVLTFAAQPAAQEPSK